MKRTRYLVISLDDLKKRGVHIWECLPRLADYKQKKLRDDDLNTKYIVHPGAKLPPPCIPRSYNIYKFNGTKLIRTAEKITLLGE